MLQQAKIYFQNAFKSIKNPLFFLGFIMFFLSSVSVNIIAKTFNLYMQNANYNAASIIFVMSIITFPYTYKAFIIPLIDSVHIPVIDFLGKYKSLILYFYIIVIAAVFSLSIISIEHLWLTSVISFVGFLFGICIDAMVSGYFNSISPNDRTWIKGGLMGYNVGIFLAIQAPLFFSGMMHWQHVYRYISMILLCFIPIICFLPKCNTSAMEAGNEDANEINTNNADTTHTTQSYSAFTDKGEQYQSSFSWLFTRLSAYFSPFYILYGKIHSSRAFKAYAAPFSDLYSHYKSHFAWLLMTLAFYRAPDRLMGYLLTYVKREILGDHLYQIVTLIASISIFISPLLWSEIKNTHFDRLIFINKIHTATIFLFGIAVMLWYKTHSAILIYVMIVIFIALKFIRLLESSAWFSYHCDLTTNTKYFQSQLSICTSIEQGCAKIATLLMYPLLNLFGNAYIFFIIAFTSMPAIFALNKMKSYQEILTRVVSSTHTAASSK